MQKISATWLLVLLGAASALAGTSWEPSISYPPAMGPRIFANATFDSSRGRLVLFGGSPDGASFLNDTWEFDGATWSPGPAAPPGLTPRGGQAMAYHTQTGKVVLFGGLLSGGLGDDTWEYDGQSWAAGPAAPTGLAARYGAGSAFDDARGRMVVFGGVGNSGLRRDTWEYDGTSWLAGPAAPSNMTRRIGPAMAYYPTRDVIVMYGGGDAQFNILGDSWEYDGAGWMAGVNPPAEMAPRVWHSMVFDPRRGVMTVHGGTPDLSSELSDTWDFDGTGWYRGATTPTVMPGRIQHTMIFDQTLGRPLVLGGGDTGHQTFDDAWELDAAGTNLAVGEGLGSGNPNRVRVTDASGIPTGTDFLAYSAGSWGAKVSAGRTRSGAIETLLTGPGPGSVFGPQLRGFANDGSPLGQVNFYAYGTLKFGVNPSAGEMESDSFDEILSGAGPGAVFGPHVRGWNHDGQAASPIGRINYFAYSTLKYGVHVSVGDIDADVNAELLTGAGPGAPFGPTVRGWNYDGQSLLPLAKVNFNAFSTAGYGVLVAGGPVDDDLYAEVLCATGPGGSSTHEARFRGYDFDGSSISALPGFDVAPYPGSQYGGHLGTAALSGVGAETLLVGSGPDPAIDSMVHLLDYDGQALNPRPASFTPFTSGYGVTVAGYAGDL